MVIQLETMLFTSGTARETAVSFVSNPFYFWSPAPFVKNRQSIGDANAVPRPRD